MLTCYPCTAGLEHLWHDNGSPHMLIQCDDLTSGWEQQRVLRLREEICEAGHCVCQERRPMMRSRPTQFDTGEGGIRALVGQDTIANKTAPSPRTPRIEEGTKVVLPDGQVRTIESVDYAYDDSPSPSLIGLTVTFTNRWSPRVR